MSAVTLVVMQPTFLPWAGYFNLMARADDFVFLDDVQLERQSWQTRNRLLVNGQAHWISVPVRHTHLQQTIAQTDIVDSSGWRRKLARTVSLNYAHHPHCADVAELMDCVLNCPAHTLADLNEAVIRFVADRLALSARLHRSSALGVPGVRTQRLTALCARLGASVYLSPAGSADYLQADGFEAQTHTRLQFQDYQPAAYAQRKTSAFVSHLSIVDVLAHLGWAQTRAYIE